MTDVYLYGMILVSNSILLSGSFPAPEDYSEISSIHKLPGGETGTCATILNKLGCTIKMDGNHLGKNTYPIITKFYENTNVDLASITYDPNYDGIEDYILIDQYTRTCFGTFHKFYSDKVKRWNLPSANDIMNASVIGLDPYFGDSSIVVAKLCHKLEKPYVTIDCPYDSLIFEYASITILSSEYLRTNYPDLPIMDLIKEYLSRAHGLVIFTFGANDAFYGRTPEDLYRFTPYQVDVVSTLGAGDSFKAGCIYGLLHQMKDDKLVAFASAVAGLACTKYPLPLYPPSLEEVTALYNTSL